MDLETLIFLAADALMVASGFIYGWKFLRKRNVLLGLEWMIVATSGTNFFVYSLVGSPFLYNISYFFDAFSRALGFPLLGVVGLMAVTHRYRPSFRTDVVLFAVSIAVAVVLVVGDHALGAVKPWLYVLTGTALSAYLLYFIWRLLKAGEILHALGTTVVLVTLQAIATIYDFYHIPGDDDQHTLFYIFALSTWGFAMFELYYAYCALERAENT